MRIKIYQVLCLVILAVIFGGLFICCKSTAKTYKTRMNFDAEKYLGEWYEIARFDFKFEKNMSHVKANYSMNPNGTIRVENSGFDYIENKMKTKIGKAKFKGANDVGELKVSFFGPFYSGYNIIALDPEYKYSLVAGDSHDLLWILSRTPTIPDDVMQNYLDIARNAGFDVDNLVWTKQD